MEFKRDTKLEGGKGLLINPTIPFLGSSKKLQGCRRKGPKCHRLNIAEQ